MGLDIRISVNNYEEVYDEEHRNNYDDYFKKHSLSRNFCSFMCRRNVINHEPELEQIGKITGIDISLFYEMEKYIGEEELRVRLMFADSEEEKNKLRDQAETIKRELAGNIDKVLAIINGLIEQLSQIDDLPALFISPDLGSLQEGEAYFRSFNIDVGEGYMGNNFGQDLRNFQRFLEYAKKKGTTSVWFDFG